MFFALTIKILNEARYVDMKFDAFLVSIKILASLYEQVLNRLAKNVNNFLTLFICFTKFGSYEEFVKWVITTKCASNMIEIDNRNSQFSTSIPGPSRSLNLWPW